MKRVIRAIGTILCVISGFLMVSGIIATTQIGSCGDFSEQACPSGTGADVFKIIGGSFLLTIGAVMTMGMGVLLACVAAGITLFAEHNGQIATLVGIFLIVLPGLIMLGVMGARRTAATRAVQTAAFKAHAIMVPGVITAVNDTGVTINDNPRVAITVEYRRADGSTGRLEHKRTVSRVAIPGVGSQVTVWYDPTGGKAVVEFTAPDPSLLSGGAGAGAGIGAAGIGMGMNPAMGITDAVPPMYAPGSASSSPLVAALERLAALHRDGSLTESEYAHAKQRLLNGS